MASQTDPPGRAITLPSLLNLRDLGGYPTADGGTVRRGLLFRSTDTSRLSDSDLLTNEQLVPYLLPRLKPFADAGGDVSLLEPVIGVRTEYLDAAFDEMSTKFGSFEDYISKGLGIDAKAQQQLRDRLVER